MNLRDMTHRTTYGRLFLNKVAAYKYEKSMIKSYHKKIMNSLNHLELDYCYQIYSHLR
jgi:hypothetical protein